jgi:hypothetical protein
MNNSSDNVPIEPYHNVPIELLVPLRPPRRNITSKEIEDLAPEKFKNTKEGIGFRDLTDKFGVSKQRAQRKLKVCCENHYFGSKKKVLFTPEQRKPQRYYPSA